MNFANISSINLPFLLKIAFIWHCYGIFFDLGWVKTDFMNKLNILLALLLCLVSCKQTAKPVVESNQPIKVVKVISDSVVTRQGFIATLQPNYVAVVQPRVSGFLSAKLFDNGMPVKRGQVIFRIDDREQWANLLSARADFETAKANAIEAQNNYNRAVPLVAIDAISQAQFDQYKAQYEAAKASTASAEQRVKNSELEVEYTTIRATIDGVISASEAYVGDYVGPGTKFSTLTRIENIDTLCADIAIPMADYLKLSGRKSFTYNNESLLSDITLSLADGSVYPYKGSYSYTKSAVADTEGTIIIVVTFPNPNYLLKSGQFARLSANVGEYRRQTIVPASAVRQIQGVNSVWVIGADSVAEYRQVTVLGNDGKSITLTGVNSGESVALDGNVKLTNGQKVNSVL